jgi:large subunit ribosomal protein L9
VKIVLRSDVTDIGHKGDVLDVSDGYARNYLIPKGLAFKATPGSMEQSAAMRRTRELREAAEVADAQAMADRLADKVIRIGANAGEEGKLFGSVTTNDIVTALAEQANVVLDRKVVDSEPIKSLGLHTVLAHVHPAVTVTVTVEVVAV